MMKNYDVKLPIKQDFYKLKKTLTDQKYYYLFYIQYVYIIYDSDFLFILI